MSRAVPGVPTLRAPRLLLPLLLAAATGCIKGEVGESTPPVGTRISSRRVVV